MTVTLGVGLIIGVAVVVLVFLDNAAGLYRDRVRRQTVREQWERGSSPANTQEGEDRWA